MDKESSVSAQNICTCEKDFRHCSYWSKVVHNIKIRTGKDLIEDPTSFDMAYFNQFAYKDWDGFTRSFQDRVKAFVTREWCELGRSYKWIPGVSHNIRRWLENNWLLYQTMSEVAERPVVVDSSKHLMIALLLQQYRPQNVILLFLHRSIEGLVASTKRWAVKKNRRADLQKVMRAKKTFEQRVAKYKRNIKDLHYIDIDYEEMVQNPADFLQHVIEEAGASHDYHKQPNDHFFIDPSSMHLVAGNPMRYRGLQQVKYDKRWREELSRSDLQLIKRYKNEAGSSYA